MMRSFPEGNIPDSVKVSIMAPLVVRILLISD